MPGDRNLIHWFGVRVPGPDVSYDYDDNGNLTDLDKGCSLWDYTYNAVNALDSEKLTYGAYVYDTTYGFDIIVRMTN